MRQRLLHSNSPAARSVEHRAVASSSAVLAPQTLSASLIGSPFKSSRPQPLPLKAEVPRVVAIWSVGRLWVASREFGGRATCRKLLVPQRGSLISNCYNNHRFSSCTTPNDKESNKCAIQLQHHDHPEAIELNKHTAKAFNLYSDQLCNINW